MVCKKCFESLKNELVGQEDGNSKVTGISTVPSGVLVFSNNFIPIYIQVDKTITKGKNKGNIKKDESLHYFKSNFCPKCGVKFDDEKEKIVSNIGEENE